MKIVHCPRRFTLNSWGGTETCLVQLAKSQRAAGHDASIFTTKALDSNHEDKICDVPVKRFNYQYPFFGLTRGDKKRLDQSGGNLLSLQLLKALLLESDVNILHAHTTKRLGGVVRTAAKMKNIPYAVTLHGGMFNIPAPITNDRSADIAQKLEWGKIPGAILGSRRVLADANVIFCLSNEELISARREIPDARLEYLPNGVNCDVFRNTRSDRFRIKHRIDPQSRLLLNVGRIDPQKNQLLLIETMHLLLQKHANFHLLLIGHITNDDYYWRIKQYIVALNLERHVTLIPGLAHEDPDLLDAYSTADVFCLPSIHEPFGLVILEAWAAGLPVIASAVGGIPDFTNNEKDIVLAQNSRPIHWSKQVLRVLDSQLKYDLVEHASRRVRREYDWSIISERLLQVYEDLRR